MRRLLQGTMKASISLLVLVILQFKVLGQTAGTSVTFRLKNPVNVSANTFEYEVYMINSGTTSLLLRGYSFGVNYATAVSGTGTLTHTFLSRGASLANIPAPTSTWSNQQLRLTTNNATAGNEALVAVGDSVLLAKMRVVNTINFPIDTKPDLALQTVTAAGKTQCVATCIVAGTSYAINGTANAAASGTLQALTGVVYTPCFFLNPSGTFTASTSSVNNVACFGGSNGSASITLSSTGSTGTGTTGTYKVNGGANIAYSSLPISVNNLSGGNYVITVTTSYGCVDTANVLISAPSSPITTSFSATACNSYTLPWSATVTSSGTYSHTYTTAASCDSIVTANITINNSSTTTDVQTACNSYSWNGNTYTSSGTYTFTSLNAVGCVNTATLNLTINSSTSNATSVTACDSYVWSVTGQNYLASGAYTSTSVNALGCIHTETLNLTINSSTTSAGSDTACDTYTWTVNGTTYTSSGTYSSTSLNPAGCTHTSTLGLTINVSTTSSQSATACDSYTWPANSTSYTTSGVYTSTSINASGCLHTSTLNLAINSYTTSNTTISVAGSYTWSANSITYFTSGIYTATLVNSNGCDSIATLDLTISGANFSLSVIEDQAISCFGNADAAAQATAIGTGTYTYSIDGGPFNNITGYFSGLSAGTHTVCATDGAFTVCDTIVFASPLPLAISFVIDSTVSCLGNDGQISAIVTGGTTNLQSYLTLWTNANTPPDTLNNQQTNNYDLTVSNLPTGVYFLHVEDDNGCFVSNSVTLGATTPVTVNASFTPIACAGGTSIISAAASGGLGTLSITVNGAPLAANYPAGTYTVTAVDTKGCSATSVLNITTGGTSVSSTTASVCDLYVWSANAQTYTSSGIYSLTFTGAGGCDSIVTLNLTINQSSQNAPQTVSACDSYTWPVNGVTYTASGIITASYTNAAGCDSSYTLNLTVNASTNSTQSETACNSYTWPTSGTTYTASGTYSFTTLNGSGCTQTSTLNLTVNASTSSTQSQTACNAYTWPTSGATYTASGTYTSTSLNSVGCTETSTLNLTINASTSSTQSQTACNSYTWSTNGQTYSVSGTYTSTSQNAVGCTHTSILNLTINTSTTSLTSVTANNTYTWSVNGVTYTTTGVYTATSFNSTGCVNTATLNLTINYISFSNSVYIDQPISCYGNNDGSIQAVASGLGGPYTYILDGNAAVNSTGFFNNLAPGTHTVCALSGLSIACDTITLTQPPPIDITFVTTSMVSCHGNDGILSADITGGTNQLQGYLTWWTNSAGDTLNDILTNNFALFLDSLTAGSYNLAVEDDNGCFYSESGSILVAAPISVGATFAPIVCNNGTTNLQIIGSGGWNQLDPTSNLPSSPVYTSTLSYSVNGSPFSTQTSYPVGAGTYTIVAMDAKGCSNSTVVNITQPGVLTSSVSVTQCDTYTWPLNNVTYTTSGVYTTTLLSVNNCDSIVTLNLTINYSTNSSVSVTSCDSYTWLLNGTTYTASGTYTFTSLNAAGCLNTATLNLTINYSSTSSQTATACNTYTWTANGLTYTSSGTYISTSLNAAGCTQTSTLNLTINLSTTSTQSETACDTYTWLVNGQTYTVGGTYTATSTNAAGCLQTNTLNLTINASTSSTQSQTACDTYTWTANGVTYTASGVYTVTSLNAVGCLLTSTLNLTINNSTTSTQSETACDTYTWTANGTTYTTSGVYTSTSLNAAGCTLTSTLNLTINASTTSTQSETACDTYTWTANGTTYTASGVYTATSLNAAGCVLTSTLNLTINNSTTSTQSQTACDTYTWTANGTTYTASGTYTATSTNAAGCTLTNTLNLTINLSTTASQSVTSCGTYTWAVNGTSYTTGGAYTATTLNAAGCTQTSTLLLTVGSNSTNAPLSANNCGSYTWALSGQTYTASGVYTASFQNVSGCDSSITLNLTVNSPNGDIVNTTAGNVSSVAGNTCDTKNHADGAGQTYTDNFCRLIATINDAAGGNVLGSVQACATVLPAAQVYNGQPYFARSYSISTTSDGPSTITLYLTQDDFDDYNAIAGTFPTINASTSVGSVSFCVAQVPQTALPGAPGVNTIEFAATATWNASASRWEVILPTAVTNAGYYFHACNPFNTPLPVNITRFDGHKGTSTDILEWTTSSEQNNAYFNLQHSTDGVTFTTLAKVNSKAIGGNSNTDLNYSTINPKPVLGHNYYRLQQVDLDGHTSYETRIVDLIWGAEGSSVSIYPNPATNVLNIDYLSNESINTHVKILDMSGRTVKQVLVKSQAGMNSINIDIAALADGIYTVQIFENNNLSFVQKVRKNN